MNNSKINQRKSDGINAENLLYVAMSRGAAEGHIKFLFENVVAHIDLIDLNAQDVAGQTFLHLAVKSKNKEMVKLLLKHQQDPNIADKEGNTALHIAILSPEPSATIVKDLINAGAKLNKQNEQGQTFRALLDAKYPEARRLNYEIALIVKSLNSSTQATSESGTVHSTGVATPKYKHRSKVRSTKATKKENGRAFDEGGIVLLNSGHTELNIGDTTIGSTINAGDCLPSFSCGTNPNPSGVSFNTTAKSPNFFGYEKERSSSLNCFASGNDAVFAETSEKTTCFTTSTTKEFSVGCCTSGQGVESANETTCCPDAAFSFDCFASDRVTEGYSSPPIFGDTDYKQKETSSCNTVQNSSKDFDTKSIDSIGCFFSEGASNSGGCFAADCCGDGISGNCCDGMSCDGGCSGLSCGS